MVIHNFRDFCLASQNTRQGMFFCPVCKCWIRKQRWIHYKKYHRDYVKAKVRARRKAFLLHRDQKKILGFLT